MMWVNSHSEKELLEAIEKKFKEKDNRIQYLSTENKLLHDSAYKDIQLAEMQKRLDYITDEYYRGFPISKEEQAGIHDWMHEHEAECKGGHGCSGGKYRYVFVPTGLGTVGYVQCGKCNAEYQFQDI